MTISLWDTREHVQAVEAHAALARREAGAAMDAAIPDVTVFEVALQASAAP